MVISCHIYILNLPRIIFFHDGVEYGKRCILIFPNSPSTVMLLLGLLCYEVTAPTPVVTTLPIAHREAEMAKKLSQLENER